MTRSPSPRYVACALACCALTSCLSLRSDTRARLAIFDTVRSAIAADYPFLGRKALDWSELAKQYRSAVNLAHSPSSFYHLLAGMLAELDDRHVSIEIPAANWVGSGGAREDYRLDHREGFRIAFIEGRLHVTSWPAGEAPVPPDHLGSTEVQLPELVEVERYRAVPSLLDIYFRGPAGSPVALTLRWRDGSMSRHVLRRPTRPSETARADERAFAGRMGRVASSPLRVHNLASQEEGPLFDLREEREFSILRIRSFAPNADMTRERFLSEVHEAIDTAIESGKPLVVDLRANGGGLLGLAMNVARRFLPRAHAIAFDEPDRSILLGLVNVEMLVSERLEPLLPVFERGVAVLIDSLTASAAELLARTLQDGAQAIVIGERSAGIAASRKEVALPDGSSLRFGAGDILDARGNTLQDRGVLPDVPVRQIATRFARLGWTRGQREWNARCYRAVRRALAAR